MNNTNSSTEVYFELKCKDTFGDIWTTGNRFTTLAAAQDFASNPAQIKARQAARRNAESLAGVKFSKQNPCSWQVDRVTIS